MLRELVQQRTSIVESSPQARSSVCVNDPVALEGFDCGIEANLGLCVLDDM
jgi:hypothetical protein